MAVDYYAFASDNASGICPESWKALEEANAGHAGGYGADRYTEEALRHLRDLFETDLQAFFVFNGTAANALALSAICQGHHAIVAHENAHIMTDECGAPEHFTGGAKILGCPGEGAKLTVEGIRDVVSRRREVHFPKPRALSLTQATEFGTVYQTEEIAALAECARGQGLRVHLDGGRGGGELGAHQAGDGGGGSGDFL
jgi:threonine aldolase